MKKEESEAEIDSDIATHCILELISNVESIPQEERPTLSDVPSAANLRGAQQTDTFRQHTARTPETDPVLWLMITD